MPGMSIASEKASDLDYSASRIITYFWLIVDKSLEQHPPSFKIVFRSSLKKFGSCGLIGLISGLYFLNASPDAAFGPGGPGGCGPGLC